MIAFLDQGCKKTVTKLLRQQFVVKMRLAKKLFYCRYVLLLLVQTLSIPVEVRWVFTSHKLWQTTGGITVIM